MSFLPFKLAHMVCLFLFSSYYYNAHTLYFIPFVFSSSSSTSHRQKAALHSSSSHRLGACLSCTKYTMYKHWVDLTRLFSWMLSILTWRIEDFCRRKNKERKRRADDWQSCVSTRRASMCSFSSCLYCWFFLLFPYSKAYLLTYYLLQQQYISKPTKYIERKNLIFCISSVRTH